MQKIYKKKRMIKKWKSKKKPKESKRNFNSKLLIPATLTMKNNSKSSSNQSMTLCSTNKVMRILRN